MFRIFYLIVLVFIIETFFIEAIPQNLKSAKYNEHLGIYPVDQKKIRQGSIEEFLALRPTTKNPYEHKPCIPVQFYKKIVHPNHQNINIIPSMVNYAKPPYNAYGGYFCQPYKPASPVLPPGQYPLHNNFWPNLIGGFLGSNND